MKVIHIPHDASGRPTRLMVVDDNNVLKGMQELVGGDIERLHLPGPGEWTDLWVLENGYAAADNGDVNTVATELAAGVGVLSHFGMFVGDVVVAGGDVANIGTVDQVWVDRVKALDGERWSDE